MKILCGFWIQFLQHEILPFVIIIVGLLSWLFLMIVMAADFTFSKVLLHWLIYGFSKIKPAVHISTHRTFISKQTFFSLRKQKILALQNTYLFPTQNGSISSISKYRIVSFADRQNCLNTQESFYTCLYFTQKKKNPKSLNCFHSLCSFFRSELFKLCFSFKNVCFVSVSASSVHLEHS